VVRCRLSLDGLTNVESQPLRDWAARITSSARNKGDFDVSAVFGEIKTVRCTEIPDRLRIVAHC
jgi:hypothetical protein